MKTFITALIICLSTVAWAQENSSVAKYPGGAEEFFKYLKDSLEYPQDAIADSTEGVVLVEFVVSPSGEIDDGSINIVKPLRQSCDDEAKRLIAGSVAWQPARSAGVAVEERIVFPVSFVLSNH